MTIAFITISSLVHLIMRFKYVYIFCFIFLEEKYVEGKTYLA